MNDQELKMAAGAYLADYSLFPEQKLPIAQTKVGTSLSSVRVSQMDMRATA